MKTVSNYGYITIPSKMNDLTIGECEFLYPHTKETPLYPNGIALTSFKKPFKVRKQHGGTQYHVGYFKTFLEAIIGLENYCTKHKLKLF